MDGVGQISAHLAKKRNLSAIHIISHGNAGHFILNGKRIDSDFLRDHGHGISGWGKSLTESGDILLYACNLAATDEGKAFVERFLDLTGADVAASTDVTGGQALDGNWDLEYSVGQITSQAITLGPNIDVKLLTCYWNASATNGNWALSTNWTSCGSAEIPDSDDTAIIISSTNPPELATARSCVDVTVSSGTLTFSGGSMAVSGDFTNEGIVSATGTHDISISGGSSSAINLKGNITSGTGSVTLTPGSGGINLTGNSTITSTNGTVTFGGAIDGDFTLDVDAGTGSVDFQQAIGSATTLKSLTITQSAGTTFQNNVTTSISVVLTDTADDADITFSGTLITPTLTTANQGYNVKLHGGCTIDNGTTTFSNTGTTTIGNDSSDTSTFEDGLTATAGPVSIAGTVATQDNALVLGATTQTANSTLKSTGEGSAAITVASMTGDYNLTLQENATEAAGSEVTFTGNLSAKDLITFGQGYAVTLQGASNVIDSHTTFNNTGTTTIGNDSSDTSTFEDGLTATAGSVNIAGTIATTNTAMALGATTQTANSTLKSGSGATTVTSMTGAFDLTLQDNTTGATGGVTFTGNLTVNDLITYGQGYAVTLQGASNVINNDTSFLNTGTTTIGDSGDSSTFTGGLDATAGPVRIAGTIATTNSAMDLGSTTQTANSILKSGTGAITVASMTGDFDLTLQSDETGTTGEVKFTGNLAANKLITFIKGYAVTLEGTSNVIGSDTSFLNTDTTTIGNDSNDGSTFTEGFDATSTGGVSIAGTIATTNSAMDLGATTVSDDSTINPAGGAVTLASATINDAKTLIVGTGNTGAISFSSTINSAAGGAGNLTINTDDTATFSGSVGGTALGTLKLTAGTVSAGTNSITAGTITVDGGTFGLAASPSGVWDVGNVSIASGATMNATTGAFNVSGNWANSGTFNHKDRTVTLDGTDQSISGSTTFYNLEKSIETADTLTFQNGTANKTIVANTLQLQGGSGALLSLRSSSTGSQWEINPQGTRTITYLDVKDSNNVNGTEINAVGTNSVSNGNNTNWTFPDPTITSFSPTSGGTSTSVTITGTNFSGATAVTFGGTDASSYTVDSTTQITAVVGSGTTGKVAVTTSVGTATSAADFTFIATPAITSFSPTSGGTSTSVTITGTNFSGATAVTFGGTDASSYTVDSTTQITAVVGSGTTGKVAVTTPGGTTTSAVDFTYTAITARTYHVNNASGNDSYNGSATHPWKTLHHAISQINGGAIGTYVLYVALGTGTYSTSTSNGEANAQLVLSQSSVTIKGESGSGPIIDGTGASAWTKGLEITGSDVTLVNLYVTGFSDTNDEGIRISGGTGNEIRYCKVYTNNWGIRVNEATNAIVKNCDIYNNSTHGIDIVQSTGTTVANNKIHANPQYGIRAESSPEITRNEIYDNEYGIFLDATNANTVSPTIKNNVIYEVVSDAMSYGIFTRSNNNSVVNPKIIHNTIDGGKLSGISMEKDGTSSSAPIIKYNIITEFGEFGINNSGADPTINYNDVWANTVNNYNGCTAGANDISSNPMYGSYSLQSSSPCIGTIPSGEGDSATLDYPGFKRPRPRKTTKDMGAYEYVADVTNNYALPGGTGVSTDYRIFTVPLNLGTGSDMLNAMENVLGSYDPAHWRGFLYTGSYNREFNSSQFASHTIIPGMGFWIVTTYTDNIPFEAKPAPDGVDFVMELGSGWHLIALPWISTQITLSSIKVTDGVNTYAISSASNDLTQRFMWDYTGSGPISGYVKQSAVGFRLQNNKGYFFKVLAGTSVKLIIPYSESLDQSAPVDIPPDQTNTNGDDEAPPPPPRVMHPSRISKPTGRTGRFW